MHERKILLSKKFIYLSSLKIFYLIDFWCFTKYNKSSE